MHTLNIRNIEDSVYNSIKDESKKKGISMNKLILNVLSRIFNKKKELVYDDLDDFFGTWSEEEYNRVMEVSKELRKIDNELWK